MPDITTESKVIMALERQWCQKLQEKDIDRIVNLFAEQGERQFPPNAEPVVGAQALRKVAVDMFNTSVPAGA